ncbi:MAG: sodium-dependent transporter [Acidobacteria bacterium]|nr:sodium-dependent transporter [Acidobacteriota bacterium]
MSQRDHWGSRLGFVLAAAGSAVGLGNLWKFPYIAWNNDGGAFVYVYLVCIAVIGLPLMMAEIMIGRRAQTSPVPAYGQLGFPKWAFVGWIGVAAGVIILAFYVVIAGWSISSFYNCLRWSFSGYHNDVDFGAFVGSGSTQISLSLVFLFITAIIVSRGVSKGIEKATKIMMPVLFAILLYLVINSGFLDGFGKAFTFLLRPNFGEFFAHPHGILEALGHAFFTLSLGMGAMVTYGSYMSKGESITRSAIAIVVLDTVIALTACVIMYSIIFSVPELQERLRGGGMSTSSMLFVTLPEMFYTKVPGGVFVGPIFYILVGFAALTSTISLLEVVTALLVDKLNIPRTKATFSAAGGIGVLTIGAALSLGASEFLTNMKLFGPLEWLNHKITADKAGVLAILDHVSANWFLPVGGFLFAIFVGWVFKKKDAVEELELQNADGSPSFWFNAWYFAVKVICPLVIGYIIFKVLKGADFS